MKFIFGTIGKALGQLYNLIFKRQRVGRSPLPGKPSPKVKPKEITPNKNAPKKPAEQPADAKETNNKMQEEDQFWRDRFISSKPKPERKFIAKYRDRLDNQNPGQGPSLNP
ncbi:MAG: hypothetical protein KDB27_05150 [Planctomycetales bacterium]|nr:hypothetical protein [Planctomycetales bacterium]